MHCRLGDRLRHQNHRSHEKNTPSHLYSENLRVYGNYIKGCSEDRRKLTALPAIANGWTGSDILKIAEGVVEYNRRQAGRARVPKDRMKRVFKMGMAAILTYCLG